MKREAFIRDLRILAKQKGVEFAVAKKKGKGSHYIVTFGTRWTTVKYGEITPNHAALMRKQLGID